MIFGGARRVAWAPFREAEPASLRPASAIARGALHRDFVYSGDPARSSSRGAPYGAQVSTPPSGVIATEGVVFIAQFPTTSKK